MPETTNNPNESPLKQPSWRDIMSEEKISRRDFLKWSLLALGGLALSSCKPLKTLASENWILKDNIDELNKQFNEIEPQYLNSNGNFDYEPFKTNPEFEKYLTEIHTQSEYLGKELGLNPNILKLLSSAIVSANLEDWERINPNQPPYAVRERVGAMRFYPSQGLETIKKELKENYNYTLAEIEGTFNIHIGLIHLTYGCLSKIDKSGPNTNYLELVLAQYLGGKDLVTHIKNNKEVVQGSFLRESYDIYTKTLLAMNPKGIPKHMQENSVEKNLEQIWDTATKECWRDTNLEIAKEYFFEQARKYANDEYNEILGLSEEEYLALFIAISMTESHGGVYRGPNEYSGAVGWFQVVPDAHLWQYNEEAQRYGRTEYNIYQLKDDPKASVEIGTWALMRYRFSPDFQDIRKLMKFFKAGNVFDSHWESGIWWNRVSYCMKNLIGKDSLKLGYMDYQLPQGVFHKANNFEQSEHLAGVRVER